MLFDIVNVMYCLTILLIIQKYYKIRLLYIFLLTLHLFAIFIFNDFLFNASYMPDQFRYLEVAKDMRAFNIYELSQIPKNTIFYSGLFFALFPIPFIESLYSLGMINYLLFVYIFIFMYKKNYLDSKFIAIFYLYYPSLLLYSSLSLRDMLIFTIMFFATYYILIVKKSWFGFSIIILLKFIKFQNLLMYVVAFALSLLFSTKINKYYLVFCMISFMIIFFLFSEYFDIEKLNNVRLSFYNENLTTVQKSFVSIESYLDLVLFGIPSIIFVAFDPLPWEEFGVLQLLQFVENCVIFIFILYILKQNLKYKLWKNQEVKFLNILLVLAFLIYGLVIYNSGTAVRYKFPFITIYIIYSLYFIYQAKQFYKKSEICVE